MIDRDTILATARSWIGTPYRHQASLKQVGCDCLGLVRGLWAELYGAEPEDMPAYSADWAEAGAGETLAEAARRHMPEIGVETAGPGDLLLFRWKPYLPAKHAGILTTNARMVHAQDGAVVSEVPLNHWWQARTAYAFRFPGVTG